MSAITEKLFLTEGPVKNYSSAILTKKGLPGTPQAGSTAFAVV